MVLLVALDAQKTIKVLVKLFKIVLFTPLPNDGIYFTNRTAITNKTFYNFIREKLKERPNNEHNKGKLSVRFTLNKPILNLR